MHLFIIHSYYTIFIYIDRIVILFFIWQHILYNPIKCPTRVYPDKLLKLREDDRNKENRSYQQNQNCECSAQFRFIQTLYSNY